MLVNNFHSLECLDLLHDTSVSPSKHRFVIQLEDSFLFLVSAFVNSFALRFLLLDCMTFEVTHHRSSFHEAPSPC